MPDVLRWAGIALIPLTVVFCIVVIVIMVIEDHFGIEIPPRRPNKPWNTHQWQEVEGGADERGVRVWCPHCDAVITIREATDGLTADVLKIGNVELRPKELERLIKDYSGRTGAYPRGTWFVIGVLLLLSLAGTQSGSDTVAVVAVLVAGSLLFLAVVLLVRLLPTSDWEP